MEIFERETRTTYDRARTLDTVSSSFTKNPQKADIKKKRRILKMLFTGSTKN